MIDFKYHTVSILGVFIALAFGVVLGSVVSSEGTFHEQQTKLIESIQQDIGKLRIQLSNQQKEISALKEYSELINPWVIQNRLSGKTIAIVAFTEEKGEIEKRIKSYLEEAGSKVKLLNVSIEKAMELAEKETTTAVDVMVEVADSVFLVEETSVVASYREAGVFKQEGEIAQAQNILVVAGNENFSYVSQILKSLAKKTRTPIIVVENEAFLKKVAPLVSDGVSVIFLGDTSLSKISLVLSIDSPVGIYGTKLFGGSLIPRLKE